MGMKERLVNIEILMANRRLERRCNLSGDENSTPVSGGSMRIGNLLGGLVIWVLAATISVAASAGTAERVTDGSAGGFIGRAVRRPLLRSVRSDSIRRRTENQDDRRSGR